MEKIPVDRPVIFAMNHQNALMDALAIVYNCNRQVVFMARADIFKKKMTARLLYFLKILPVFRIRDGFHSVDQNKEVFKEVFNVLENKRPVALFPEGSHLGERRLRPFKKGVARLALQAEEAMGTKHDVSVVPVGIYYSNYYHAGSDMLIVFGDPLSAEPYKDQFLENQPVALNAMTDDLARELNKVVINIDSETHYKTLHDAIEIYCPVELKKQNLKASLWNIFIIKKELAGKICSDINAKEKQIGDLKADLGTYHQDLKKHRLRDVQVAHPIHNPAGLFLKSLLSLILLPAHFYGMVLNYLPYRLPVYMARNIKDPHFISSVRFVWGLLLFFIWYLLLFILSFIIFKEILPSLAFFISVPLTGIFSFYYYKNLKKLMADFRWMRIKLKNRSLYIEITELRGKIIGAINELISK